MPAFLAPVAVESHTKNPWLSGYSGHVFKCSYRVVMDMDLTAAARAYNVGCRPGTIYIYDLFKKRSNTRRNIKIVLYVFA